MTFSNSRAPAKPDTKTQPAPYPNDTPTPAAHTVAPANIASPKVPNYDPGKGGRTVVNTEALDTFSSNLSPLIDAAQAARDKVTHLATIAPGAFDKAWTMQDAVSGDQSVSNASSTALQPSFATTLEDVASGLTDLQTATKKMSSTYTTTDELNGMKVADLQKSLDKSSSDFGSTVGGSTGDSSGGTTGGGTTGGTTGGGTTGGSSSGTKGGSSGGGS